MTDETNEAIRLLTARVESAETKADLAAEVAMGSVETIKHMQQAAEYKHAQEGENLAAMRKMVNIVDRLSEQIMGPQSRLKTAVTKKRS